MSDALLQIEGLQKYYPVRKERLFGGSRGQVRAVDDVSFEIGRGETFGLVGESGCGKTTIAKLVLRIEPPTAGRILFEGLDVATLRGKALLAYRRNVQAVFQDPYGSLSPRLRVRDIVGEVLEIHTSMTRQQVTTRVHEVLELVGMRPEHARLFPHEFSGGQRQRIAIARALAADARLLVLDEAVSALDVSIRAQVITLLEELQRELGVSYLYIGHDLATVAHLSHRVGVMYLGRLCEVGESIEVSTAPQHPYTQALFASALPTKPGDQREPLAVVGEVPSALQLPTGCRFHPRCPHAMDRCSAVEPVLQPTSTSRRVSCHLMTAGSEVVGREPAAAR
ncbi:MAG: ATP-binding cassette domain-containing protein [Acidimicrobiales bacterium]|nr:ATP-binding cassette domain-containing protein [Acidimicrobiales bacterium]